MWCFFGRKWWFGIFLWHINRKTSQKHTLRWTSWVGQILPPPLGRIPKKNTLGRIGLRFPFRKERASAQPWKGFIHFCNDNFNQCANRLLCNSSLTMVPAHTPAHEWLFDGHQESINWLSQVINWVSQKRSSFLKTEVVVCELTKSPLTSLIILSFGV